LPRHVGARKTFTRVLGAIGRNDEAAAYFVLATQPSPRTGKVRYEYALFLAGNGSLNSTITEFQTALSHSPKHPEAYYHRGHALYVKGNFKGARRHYEEAARLDAKAPVRNSSGVVYMKLRQTSQAIGQFEEEFRLRPDHTEAAENLRYVLARIGRSSSSFPQ
jgi:Flp pilus assembly protein TadD